VGRPIQVTGRSVLVGVSIGWAVADRHDTDPLMLLQRADAQLYAAKAARPIADQDVMWMPSGTEQILAQANRPAPDPIWVPIWTATPGRAVGAAHDGTAAAATAP